MVFLHLAILTCIDQTPSLGTYDVTVTWYGKLSCCSGMCYVSNPPIALYSRRLNAPTRDHDYYEPGPVIKRRDVADESHQRNRNEARFQIRLSVLPVVLDSDILTPIKLRLKIVSVV